LKLLSAPTNKGRRRPLAASSSREYLSNISVRDGRREGVRVCACYLSNISGTLATCGA
jgi:hypothetical protein